MDMTNIESGNGFFSRESLFNRMLRFRPHNNSNDYYIMAKIEGSDFSQIGIMAYGEALMPLFKIYTGNEELYAYIQSAFHEVAKDLDCKAKSYKWKDRNAHDSVNAEVGTPAA